MKDGNYYTVYGWMLNQLKLKGTKLQVFAVIYGFSRKEKACSGSLQYLAEATGCTKQTVLNALQALEEKHYIRKEQIRAKDGGVRNHYTAAPAIFSRVLKLLKTMLKPLTRRQIFLPPESKN